jgi:hypothetical protein
MVQMRCDEVIRELAAPTDDRESAALAAHLGGCPSCSEWARQAARLDRLWDATRPPDPSPEAWASVWANVARSLPSAAADDEAQAVRARPSRNGTASKIVAHPAPPTPAANPPRTWRMGAIALMVLAQAAAILVALGLAWRGPSSGPPSRNVEVANHLTPALPSAPAPIRVNSPVRVEAEIEEGGLVVIVSDGPAPQVVDRTRPEMAFSVEAMYVMAGIARAVGIDVRVEMTYGVDAMYVMFNVVESIASPRIASR